MQVVRQLAAPLTESYNHVVSSKLAGRENPNHKGQFDVEHQAVRSSSLRACFSRDPECRGAIHVRWFLCEPLLKRVAGPNGLFVGMNEAI